MKSLFVMVLFAIFALNNQCVSDMLANSTKLNPTQLHLLKLFAVNETEESLDELRDVLTGYYADKLNRKLDEMWDAGMVSDKMLDDLRGVDVRKMR